MTGPEPVVLPITPSPKDAPEGPVLGDQLLAAQVVGVLHAHEQAGVGLGVAGTHGEDAPAVGHGAVTFPPSRNAIDSNEVAPAATPLLAWLWFRAASQ